MAWSLTFAGRRTWRGALHCHSNRSDGRLAPDEVVARYASAGYDFLALTDHFERHFGWCVTDTTSHRSASFTTLQAVELSTGPWEDPSTVWINALGVPSDLSPDASGNTEALLAEVHGAGAYTTLVHPRLNQQRTVELAALDHVDAIEIYTHSMAATWPDQADGSAYIDSVLGTGRRVHINTGDDAHFVHPRDHFGSWVVVACDELAPEPLLDALRRGDYYATTGPAIRSIALEGHALHVEVESAYSIVLNGLGARWMAAQQEIAVNHEVRVARFDVSPFAGSCCRLTVVGLDGRRAWCHPVWVD